MSARLTGALPLLLLLGSCLHAQNASLEGVAIDISTGQPLSGVHVRLMTERPGPSQLNYGAESGKTGRFSIANIAPGIYMVRGISAGYLTAGKLEGMAVLPSVTLKPDQRVTDLKLEMVRHAVLTGRVLDEFGEAMDGINVEVEQLSGDEYLSVTPGRGEAETDDRGEFHIPVGPGRYRLKVDPPVDSNLKEIRTDGTSVSLYSTTYYPSAPIRNRASVVEVKAGKTAGPFDIHLLQVHPMTIAGVVTGIPDAARPWVRVRMGDNPDDPTALDPASTDAGGRFSIPNARPGHYWLQAMYNTGGVVMQSQTVEVTPDSANAANIELALIGAGNLTGTIEAPAGSGPFKVVLQPLATRVFSKPGAEGDTNKEGAFRIAGVLPGKYRVIVQPLAENAYIKTMQLDGAESSNGEIDLSRGAAGSHLKLVIDANGAQISGAVLDKDGAPLNTLAEIRLLNSPSGDDPPEREQLRGFATDGRYSIRSLRPGKYWLLAVDPLHSGDVSNPDMVKALAAGATEVEVKEGDRLVKDLHVATKDTGNGK
ncbi:MAG: carboxypeptidase-like regulatory domain-containing protein [Bryobacteraceae bacterium]